MSNSSQKEWSILLQTKIIIRVLGLFWTYPSPVSFFPSLQLPSEKEKRKFFYLSISRRRQWEKYIKDIHVKIHILLCWILGSSQSCVIGLGRKSVKDGLFIPRQPFPLKSPCSQYEVSAEKCKRFPFLFSLPLPPACINMAPSPCSGALEFTKDLCLRQNSQKWGLW